MLHRQSIFEGRIQENDREYFLQATIEVDDDTGMVEMELDIRDEQELKPVSLVRVKARIRNPFEFVASYLLHVAVHYGVCVGIKSTMIAYEICVESYKDSKKDDANMDRKARCMDVFGRAKGKSEKLTSGVKSALKECFVEAPIAAAIIP